MQVSLEKVKSQPELLSSYGFTSFLKSFGISAENVVNAIENSSNQKQNIIENNSIEHGLTITIDNAHKYVQFDHV